jgi:hypothetical protein
LREAFPFEASHQYLIFDRDQKFGFEVIAAVKATRIIPKRTSFRSPWQKDYVRTARIAGLKRGHLTAGFVP